MKERHKHPAAEPAFFLLCGGKGKIRETSVLRCFPDWIHWPHREDCLPLSENGQSDQRFK